MPDTNDGPAGTAQETAPVTPDSEILPGFAEAMIGFPQDAGPGEPKGESAVETVAEATAPEAKAETPAEKPSEPAKEEAKPDPAKAINFDGFSDKQKATWERLIKAGAVSAEELDVARKESMFQASWTRNHQKLADERKAFQLEREKAKADLEMIEKVRSNPALEAAVKAVLAGDVPKGEAPAGDDFVTRAEAERIAEERQDRRERERAERTAQEQASYNTKASALQATIHEQMKILGVDRETMRSYLDAEALDYGTEDPILAVTPLVLAKNLSLRHEAETAKKKLAAYEQQEAQRTQKQVQASKQSFPPPRSAPLGKPTLGPLDEIVKGLGGTAFSELPGLGFQNGAPH